ncbi:hypothetical protein [Kribbella solani]|uniref:Peptidoglycan/LPS O-acetylase OafA/YrhL n=1 Tax=Kribbella solani TaxID=236067 RepID=A0A841DV90_9ACTN|nr:hypothetical protein [Kribbella solani]MBB5980676.1 peptidoglycan/LPS O-acetylase OafA/YrhL [Kribbella solani]MDX3002578.1 hypothetical protein [Kribbella solani]
MPKLKLGAAVYALVAVGWLVSAALILRGYGDYAGADRWFLIATATAVALTGVLYVIGAVTRRGLIATEGLWICRRGWAFVLGLVAVEIVLAFIYDQTGGPFAGGSSPLIAPSAVAIFIPRGIQKLQEKYYEGIAEGEQELSARESGGGSAPTG